MKVREDVLVKLISNPIYYNNIITGLGDYRLLSEFKSAAKSPDDTMSTP